MASRLYLHELLQNFITNSIKYTKEGSVTVSVRNKDGLVTFEVKDTGIGISKADQAKVFKKFYRSEDYRTRETGGTGLGLYVATKLAKKLNTTINLSSRLNHGSTFSFAIKAKTND
jgi:signal transduction histidine kinase